MTFVDAPVQAYRSKSLFHVSPDARAEEVLRELQERGISSLPVVRDEVLLGIVSITDLARVGCMTFPGFAATGPSGDGRTAEQVMTTPVLTIDDQDPLWRAARKMLEHHIHRVVVTREDKPVGLISTRDMMSAVRDARVERKLADVVTRHVETIDVDASIDRAVAALSESNVRGLVVVDGEWPVGVFTRLEAIYAQSLPTGLRAQAVEHIMSYETICFDQSTPLYRVAGHAVAMAARRILAVEDRKLVGVATGFDLARVVADVW